MKKYIILLVLYGFCTTSVIAQTELPKVENGTVVRIASFESKYVTSRNIDVWLPENYSEKDTFSVLYMHDGQMLYDSLITWNKQSWKVSETAQSLQKLPSIKKFIVVGIWNGGETRHQDYFPQKPFEQLSISEQFALNSQLKQSGRTKDKFQPKSDSYLNFMVQELKPYIDSHFSVYTNPENTFVMGSSMGGLISLYALCEYPDVFGGAACLSTHWTGTFTTENNSFPKSMLQYLEQKIPNISKRYVYFDHGNKTLDSLYPSLQQKVDEVFRNYNFPKNQYKSEFFDGENHSEKAWSKRLHIPLEFLFSNLNWSDMIPGVNEIPRDDSKHPAVFKGDFLNYLIQKFDDSNDIIEQYNDKPLQFRFEYVIDSLGNVNNVKETSGIQNADLYIQKITKVIKESSGNWIPSTSNGENISSFLLQNITIDVPDSMTDFTDVVVDGHKIYRLPENGKQYFAYKNFVRKKIKQLKPNFSYEDFLKYSIEIIIDDQGKFYKIQSGYQNDPYQSMPENIKDFLTKISPEFELWKPYYVDGKAVFSYNLF